MRNMKLKTLILLLLQMGLSESAKTNTRPLYEVNEQSKTEEKKPPNMPGSLPYGNPLAGNLLQNAKLHAQNQQAMFQAERVRQHRAQLQRWAKQNLPTDSYMKAYHDTQENHQLAIERQESNINEKKVMIPTNKENRRRIKMPELTKITKEDAVTDPEKRRNHRSYGSNEYKRYYQPTKRQNVYVSSGPSHDQGITINPNGITYLNPKQPNKLYTEAVENKMQYAYPSHNQIRYEFVRDINSLNALLNKSPQDQLNGLNAIAHIEKEQKSTVETPLNVYTYLKQPQSTENYIETYTQSSQNYGNTITDKLQVKDHTPINEYVDDIEDPNKSTTIKAFGLQPVLTTQQPEEDTSTRNYINAVTQPIEYNFNVKVEEENPQTYQILQDEQPVYFSENIQNIDHGRIYLDENIQPKGVQHLKQDGQQISAYSEENVSISRNIRNRRSILDNKPFIISPNYTHSNDDNSDALPKPEQLLRHPLVKRVPPYYNINDDEDYDYDTELFDEYDVADYEYDSPNHKQSSLFTIPHRVRQSLDLTGSYSKHNLKRHTPLNNPLHSINLNDFSTSYGVPYEVYNPELSDVYNLDSFVHYKTHSPHPEPVYILTQSQLKQLLNQPNLNVKYLDLSQSSKQKMHRPRRLKKRYRGQIPKYLKRNLYKLNKLTML